MPELAADLIFWQLAQWWTVWSGFRLGEREKNMSIHWLVCIVYYLLVILFRSDSMPSQQHAAAATKSRVVGIVLQVKGNYSNELHDFLMLIKSIFRRLADEHTTRGWAIGGLCTFDSAAFEIDFQIARSFARSPAFFSYRPESCHHLGWLDF